MEDKIYIVSRKHYGDDDYCGCEFEPIIAFKNKNDAEEYAKRNEEYYCEEIKLKEK